MHHQQQLTPTVEKKNIKSETETRSENLHLFFFFYFLNVKVEEQRKQMTLEQINRSVPCLCCSFPGSAQRKLLEIVCWIADEIKGFPARWKSEEKTWMAQTSQQYLLLVNDSFITFWSQLCNHPPKLPSKGKVETNICSVFKLIFHKWHDHPRVFTASKSSSPPLCSWHIGKSKHHLVYKVRKASVIKVIKFVNSVVKTWPV